MLSFATYVITGQTTEAGRPILNKKVYHVLVDRLRILDHGDGEPWNPAVPAIPQSRIYSPVNSPQRRGRDDAADSAFSDFGAKSASPSPPKRARRNAAAEVSNLGTASVEMPSELVWPGQPSLGEKVKRYDRSHLHKAAAHSRPSVPKTRTNNPERAQGG
ncbi:hypothetical protein B0H14DRAFT_2572635 [Mycena olivaceomarginata]|nr:hypothetical protein B0H14DRAFT_2572635 [Mycena olivaceomarginata]